MLRRDTVVPEKVIREIARTDRLLERADEQGGRRGTRILREAREIQDRAKNNARETKFRLAMEQTQRARMLARQVLKSSSEYRGIDEESAANAIELTDRILHEAYEIAREKKMTAATEKLDEALRIQQNAKDRLNDGRYESALRLTRQAREIIKKAMRAIDNPIDLHRVKEALEQTDQALVRVRSALTARDDDAAGALYKRAAARQASAWDAYESGQLRRALANTKIARNLAKKALRQLGDGQS
jgi:tetratricopeptide (TPR) repeat protein